METMMSRPHLHGNIFFIPDSLGALPPLWLQAKVTISLTPFQDKFARLFMTIAAELWLRGLKDNIDAVFQTVARNVTIRLAERLANYLCNLMRNAESLATPETECLLYATYWFRPILSELIGAATETAETNRKRAPSGPVKVTVTTQPHSRPNAGVNLISGVSALLAWFPASWASKIAPHFLQPLAGSAQPPQEVNIPCPNREGIGPQRDATTKMLQAVRFADKKVAGLSLGIDEEFEAAQCFTEIIRGYSQGLVQPYVMLGLQATGAVRVTLEVIIPSLSGLTPEQWKQTATLCPLDWPSNYSLLRLWHTQKNLHQFVAMLRDQMNHRHMFADWEISHDQMASRVLFQQPPHYVTEATLQHQLRTRDFPDRKTRRRPTQADVDEFKMNCTELKTAAAAQEHRTPISYALNNFWAATLRSDKQHYQNTSSLRMT